MFPDTSSNTKKIIVQGGIIVLLATFCLCWLQIRPLCLLFLTCLGYWFFKTYSNYQLIPPPELTTKLQSFFNRAKKLRQENPTIFCAISTVTLGVFAIFGHLLSGSSVVLVMLIAAGLISTKYNFKIIKSETIGNAFISSWLEKLEHDVDEFLPESNESNLFVLERASDLASLNFPADPEIPPELLIPDVLPDIADNNDTDSSDSELTPPIPQKSAKSILTDSQIEFKRGHFKKDSSISTSSSSEEELSKGLRFPEYSVVDNQVPSSLLSKQISTIAASNILPNLMTGLATWSLSGNSGAPSAGAGIASQINKNNINQIQDVVSTKSTDLNSSDESEFEILDTDDFN